MLRVSHMAKATEKGLIVQKVGMTRVVDANGVMIPVTLLKVTPQKITKILSVERDGYTGFQVGYFEKSEKNLTKPDIHRLRKDKIEENFARFREFRTPAEVGGLEIGAEMTSQLFDGVSSVDITGITKGRGFQGSVKRWGSTIGRMTHGSRFHRRPGSLGQNSSPSRVYKNKHQPGQMGVDKCTVQNLQVVRIDHEDNVIAIKGSVPGYSSNYLELRPTIK